MNYDMFDLIKNESDAGRLTGLTEDARYEGRPILSAPEVAVSPWGGRVVPAIEALRTKYDARVDRLNAFMERAGTDFRVSYLPEFHVHNTTGDPDDLRYAQALIKDAGNFADVQHAYGKAHVRFQGRKDIHWAEIIFDRDASGRLQYPDGPTKPALLVEDHWVWASHSTVADMVTACEAKITGMDGFIADLGA